MNNTYPQRRIRHLAAALAGLLVALPAGAETAAPIPPCQVQANLNPQAYAMYGYYDSEDGDFAWLTFGFLVDGIETENLTLTPGFEPFIEFSVKIFADGTPDVFFHSMLFVGEAVSSSSGSWVRDWKSTLTYGDFSTTYDQLNMKNSFLVHPEFITRFAGVGGRLMPPQDFVDGLRAGTDMSISAYNAVSPQETLRVTIDMEEARGYFDILEQQHAIVRQQVIDGTCEPL